MSDSGEDWFDQDEDEIVKSIKKKEDDKPPPVEFVDAAANYEINYDSSSSNVPSMSFKKLKLMAEMEPLDTFLEVGTSEFLRSFNVNTKIESIVLIVKIFGKLARLHCQLPDFIADCMYVFVEDECLNRNICNLTKRLYALSHSKVWVQCNIDINDVNSDLISIFECVFELGYQNDKIRNLVDNILGVLVTVKETDKFSEFNKKMVEFQDRIKTSGEKDSKTKRAFDIFPTLEELQTTEKPLLKPNIVDGKYASVAEYLEIQKNLLREDFIEPLREAIQTIKQTKPDNPDRTVFENVKIVTNENLSVPKSDMLFVEVFSKDKSNPDDETFSKLTSQLKYIINGSLLCFSTNNDFENLVLAVVLNNDAEIYTQGYLCIEIINQRNVGRIIGVNLNMMVCPVFFEPYQHSLKVLNSFNEKNFPMARYIVYTENEQRLPGYLAADTEPKYTFQRSSFNPLLLETFPSSLKCNLTDTQLSALKTSLCSEFSLIQGPPGTGKTEISTKIAITLLTNTTLPIVVCAHTNDALDKFVVKMLGHTDSIVRLGNQSKNETLDRFNVKEIFQTNQSDQRCRRLYYLTKMEHSEKFSAFQKLQADFDGTEEEYQKILLAQEDLNTVSRKLDSLGMIAKYFCIKNKRVIAMTTTCAARHHLMLQFLKDTIMIFEEAGEVLESHILSSMTSHTQQLILVGDHQQLRPHTSVYRLSQLYKMNISLFERMVNNNINTTVLDTQFRMRPEFADLIRPLIYKDLQDGPNVSDYPNIQGIKSNLFFVNHSNPETRSSQFEASNIFEVHWMCDVAKDLMKRGYSDKDIVMLTTYRKQKGLLSSFIAKQPELKKIHVSTVDNFQGREANIVLLSLVRSNENKQIGYLKEQNRICVALSRAKMGLYIVGNMDLLAECSATWKSIKEKLVMMDAIGDKIPLVPFSKSSNDN